MIDDVDDAGKVFAHVGFHIVRLREQLRDTVIQVGGDDFVDPAFFIVSVEFSQTFGEKAVGCADEDPARFALLDLFCHIQHAFAGGDHVVDDDHIFSFNRITQEFVGNDGILAVDYGGVVSSLIEHAHIHAQNVGEIHGS